MSREGADAVRRSKAEQAADEAVRERADEIARAVAAGFQPVYEKVCRQRDEALHRAAILQTVVERIALGHADLPVREAWQALEQLGITPDVQAAGDVQH